MKTYPITETCAKNLRLKEHVCFGISPFNSYFSETRIQKLAEWGRSEFKEMHFFVPDIPSAFTLEALGYDPDKAKWKARRQAQYLFNKIHRALKNIGLTVSEAEEMILNWDRLSQDSYFTSLYSRTKALFDLNPDFRQSCLEASKWVLEKRTSDEEILSPETLQSAVRYLLAEIPLFIDSAGIAGKKPSVFCYHQCIPFIKDLIERKFDLPVSESQGFVVIEARETPSTEAIQPYGMKSDPTSECPTQLQCNPSP